MVTFLSLFHSLNEIDKDGKGWIVNCKKKNFFFLLDWYTSGQIKEIIIPH